MCLKFEILLYFVRLTWLPGPSWLWLGLAGLLVGADDGLTWPFLFGADIGL